MELQQSDSTEPVTILAIDDLAVQVDPEADVSYENGFVVAPAIAEDADRIVAIERMMQSGHDCVVSFHGYDYRLAVTLGEDREVFTVVATLIEVSAKALVEDVAKRPIQLFSFDLDHGGGALLYDGVGPFPNRTMIDMFLAEARVLKFTVSQGPLAVRAGVRDKLNYRLDLLDGQEGLENSIE